MEEHLKSLTDEQLCALSGSSAQAMEELVCRHQPLVRACARSFFLAGAEQDDLLQEGMLALLRAVGVYDPNRTASFRSFAALCVRSRMISLIRAAAAKGRRPHEDLVQTFSYDTLSEKSLCPVDERGLEERLIGKEDFNELHSRLLAALSPLERHALDLYLQGLSYRQIAKRLQRSTKSVDNAVQRIRQKLARLIIPATTA